MIIHVQTSHVGSQKILWMRWERAAAVPAPQQYRHHIRTRTENPQFICVHTTAAAEETRYFDTHIHTGPMS